MTSHSVLRSWRAIEALRAGVPNRDAVQVLGSSQPVIEEKFINQLAALRDGFSQESTGQGLLIAGDFGTGKSHLLEYLQHVALENNFVCSKVVISKETPLYDPAKVYSAAIQAAKVPDRAGAAVVAVATRIDFNSPNYVSFFQWINRPSNGLSSRFAATVLVFERGKGVRSPEVADRIIQFWSGSPLTVTELRGWLKDLGEAATYRIDRAPPAKELALQCYRFIPRLMVAAGYAGWVILVDEVELISRYSVRQRARSYSELARLMGKLEGAGIPGLTAVLSISETFEMEVLGERNDEELISRKLRGSAKNDDLLLASQAERGIRTILRDRVRLEKPTEGVIRGICNKIRDVYSQAYQWDPPFGYDVNRTLRIRQQIKRLINEWDLKRLYPGYEPEIVVTELREVYGEDVQLETPSEEESTVERPETVNNVI